MDFNKQEKKIGIIGNYMCQLGSDLGRGKRDTWVTKFKEVLTLTTLNSHKPGARHSDVCFNPLPDLIPTTAM